MWQQRQSIYSLSSDNNTVTPSELTQTTESTNNIFNNDNYTISEQSETQSDAGLVEHRPPPTQYQQEQEAAAAATAQAQQQQEPRPAIFRNSTIANADQENSLKDRIRYLTSSTLHRNSPSTSSTSTSATIMSMPFVASPNYHPNPNRQQVYTPRRSRSRATSLANSVDHRLSIIDEDNPSPPQQPDPLPPRPPKTSHRPFHRRFGIGEPPKYEGEASPPGYTFWDNNRPGGEKFQQVRDNPYIARRGGWKRLCLIFWFLLVIIIALSVGLGVGLAKNKNDNSSTTSPASASSTSKPNAPFPAGSYTFSVYLTQVRQSCTSSPQSFTCNPGTLYNSSVSGSKAQFQLQIVPSNSPTTNGDMNRNFTIATSPNPFSIDFKDVGMSLLDKGMDTERYNFQTTVQKIVFPQSSFSVKCYYNSTLLSGNLYTKKEKDNLPTTSSSPSSKMMMKRQNQQAAWSEWPYASDITQSIGGGQGVPDCYQYDASKPDQVGTRVTDGYQTRGPGEFCSCVWENWGL